MNEKDVPIRSLILVPAIVTLAVTLLRVVGELQGWDQRFFNRAPGGPGAVVGIVWLVFIFGGYFGWKLAQLGHRPPGVARVLGLSLGGLALLVLCGVALNALNAGFVVQIAVFGLAAIAAAVIAARGWPALGRVLIAYALAARVPVAVLMLVAMLGNWGTHYDVAPPEMPAVGVWTRWLLIGVVPQLTMWIAFTVIFGALFGLLGWALGRKGAQPAAA